MRPRATRPLIAGFFLLATSLGLTAATRAQTGSAPAPPAFSGSASAGGVRLTLNVPGAPVTDTPIDGGGPTAQVVVDSVGTSTGYAAFPDPGQFATTVPGLVAGILAGGAAGLPPVKGLPSPPGYPFFVSSDAANAPDVSLGSGPYQISANSEPGSSTAHATGGLQTGLTGNAALATSAASLSPSNSGGVVAKGTADLQGLTIGPLTIGEVKSVATETLDSSGTLTPSTDLSLAGLRVGGVPVELAPQGFVGGGPTYPVPLNQTLSAILKASGVTIQFVAAQTFPDRVVAPALRVMFPFAMPFAIPNVGKFSGTATLIIGSATAQMSSATDAGSSTGGAASSAADTGGSSSGSNDNGATAGTSAGTTSPAFGTSPSGPTSSAPSLALPAARTTGVSRVGRTHGTLTFASAQAIDTRSLYLVLVAGVVVALAAGLFIRWMGGSAT